MCTSLVNFERMCAISFSTLFLSCSGLEQFRKSEMNTVRPRACGRAEGAERVVSGRLRTPTGRIHGQGRPFTPCAARPTHL